MSDHLWYTWCVSWDDKEMAGFGGSLGYHHQKVKDAKPPRPLAVGHWFRVQHGDGEDEFTWLKVIENLGFKVLMETRFGARLTVDRKLVQSKPAKRPAKRSGV